MKDSIITPPSIYTFPGITTFLWNRTHLFDHACTLVFYELCCRCVPGSCDFVPAGSAQPLPLARVVTVQVCRVDVVVWRVNVVDVVVWRVNVVDIVVRRVNLIDIFVMYCARKNQLENGVLCHWPQLNFKRLLLWNYTCHLKKQWRYIRKVRSEEIKQFRL